MRYLNELNRASKRNAKIRNERKLWRDETDIPSDELAHIRRRHDKPSKNRWAVMASQLSRELETVIPIDPEAAERYLRRVRSEVEALERKERKVNRIRTKIFDESFAG